MNNYVVHDKKIRKNINPENFLRNAKQQFPCQSLESLPGEYYSKENKILDFQFGLVSANQTRPNYSFSQKFLRNHFSVSTFPIPMYLRKYKFSKPAFLENISRQLSLYIIWFGVSPKRKYYFMSGTYLKPSQTSKMKLLAKVVNASRDIFRKVLRTYSEHLGWRFLQK